MGEQVKMPVSGQLYYVPFREFVRIRNLQVTAVEKTALFAALCRINTLYMIARAGSGHIGSSFSSMDIMSWLQLNEIYQDQIDINDKPRNIFFSSKGHDAPALYNTMIGLGLINFDLIHQLRRLNGLPGHPDISTPNIVTNTGSLGMGISKAKGMIFSNRIQNKTCNVYVLTGDGELQEGQIWESLVSAANYKFQELIVIIDHNKLQSDTLVSKVSDLGNLEAKFSAFGWHVSRCDGNNIASFAATLEEIKSVIDKPKVIIADTVKGKGVSFMEHTSIDSDVDYYKFHSGAPSVDDYLKAAQELIDAGNAQLSKIDMPLLELEIVNRPIVMIPPNQQRLIQAYSSALLKQAQKNPNIVALNADLILDTGLIPFQKEFPNRFLECGIAEQDMVSQAGGMALRGLLPVVHSFSCFLSARPNEQIYNNATERTKIIYVGSLAGVVPGGPGHSHQAVRDISSLSAIPGLVIMEPSCEDEVGLLLDWAINKNPSSSYLRLVSLPWVIPFTLPKTYTINIGKGISIVDGEDIALIAYGSVLLSAAVAFASAYNTKYGKTAKVINLPWLNKIDSEWLLEEILKFNLLITLDNHYLEGGQGQRIKAILGEKNRKDSPDVISIAIDRIPECGTNEEILTVHNMTCQEILKIVESHECHI